jgi:hypothetical protein
MNNTFSFQRLSLLIKKHWAENNRFYGLATMALLGVLVISFIFWMAVSTPYYHEEGTVAIYFVGLFLIGSILASNAFHALGEKEKGQYWLSLPATHAEKLVTVILFTTVLFFVVYTACFFLIKWLAVGYIQMQMKTHPEISFRRIHLFSIPGKSDEFATGIRFILLAFVAVQALFLLGSVYFKKYAFIKTIIIGVCIIGIYVYFIAQLFTYHLPANYRWEGYHVVLNNLAGDDSIYQNYSFGVFFEKLLLVLAQFLWAPVFWLTAWFRLKEKEI